MSAAAAPAAAAPPANNYYADILLAKMIACTATKADYDNFEGLLSSHSVEKHTAKALRQLAKEYNAQDIQWAKDLMEKLAEPAPTAAFVDMATF